MLVGARHQETVNAAPRQLAAQRRQTIGRTRHGAISLYRS
jgi:hypothetical protein